MKVVYIHGLNSSDRSFAYILRQLPEHDAVRVNYRSHQPLKDSIAEVTLQLPKRGPFAIVGHSLGGVIGSIIATEHPKVSKLITISSPLGGSKAANILQWLPNHPPLVRDITPRAPYVELLREFEFKIPTLSIISTGGSLPTTNEPNDSVVTVASQKSMFHAKKVEVKANHFEVLVHDDTVDLVKIHLFGEDKE